MLSLFYILYRNGIYNNTEPQKRKLTARHGKQKVLVRSCDVHVARKKKEKKSILSEHDVRAMGEKCVKSKRGGGDGRRSRKKRKKEMLSCTYSVFLANDFLKDRDTSRHN